MKWQTILRKKRKRKIMNIEFSLKKLRVGLPGLTLSELLVVHRKFKK